MNGWLALAVAVSLGLSAVALGQDELPPDSAYVQVEGDHLTLDGERIRFWGHIGHFPNPKMDNPDPRGDQELMVQRMKDLGFNMHRLWHTPEGEFAKGDDSRDDLKEYGIALLIRNDVKIWFSAMDGGAIPPDELAQAAKSAGDPETADAWIEAARSMAREHWSWQGERVSVGKFNLARHWDPRFGQLMIDHMIEAATHRNQYTGRRYCDEPGIAVWELTNEEWWVPRMTAGEWQQLPDYFQDQLIARWHDFLGAKYGSEEALDNAWKGLLPGESLDEGTILLAPMRNRAEPAKLNDSNPHAIAAMTGVQGEFGREDFVAQRGADVIEFFTDLLIRSKRKQAEVLKSLGKSTRLSPLLWDTGIGSNIQCTYLHQQADAITQCTYINGKHHDRTHPRFPFNSGLEEMPKVCWDLPWVEHNRIKGKPFFVYETQIKNSTKYRAEFPMRMAALGAIQDWDIICWHSYGPGHDSSADQPFDGLLEVGHSLDLHYGRDEVQLSAMKAAAQVFKHGLLEPAGEPTHLVFGGKLLYDPESMDYPGSWGRAAKLLLPTVYRHGLTIEIRPDLDDQPDHPYFEGDAEKFNKFKQTGLLIKGPTLQRGVFETSPIRPTDQIAFDWRRGNLTMDAPGVAMFTGFYGELQNPGQGVKFEHADAKFSDVRVVNPPDMPYPVTEDERYVAIALTSADGKPLAECERALVSAVSTSFNKGFQLDTDQELSEFFGAGTRTAGELPVQVARVGCTIECPAIEGMNYTLRDYHMNAIGQGTVRDGKLTVPADKPVFVVELTR
ncbi:MAG: hypothetical protein GVY24_06265 [Planctomycetes bacterium]|jgi:hypothetical protein|nr:hypothetical protein [Planctomycetota bacterium]